MRLNLRFLYILTLLGIFLFAENARPAPVVSVKLDSVNLKMGNMTNLHVSLSQSKNLKGHFPLLSNIKERGYVGVCGDSVEFRSPSKFDTVVNGNMMHISFDLPVQAFDSGAYTLPQIEFVYGKDTVKSNALGLKVYPVVAEADTPIHDYASVADPADKSFFDFIPDWILDLWWLWIMLILIILLFIYSLKRYRKTGYIIPPKPEPTPYEQAISSLKALKEKQLWEQGLEKEYFTELTDILRLYLNRRFSINAMEMTSRQIVASLKNNKEIAEKRNYFKQILEMADFVKFAKVRPLPEDNVQAFDNAVKFVEETKPVVSETESTGDSIEKEKQGKGGKK